MEHFIFLLEKQGIEVKQGEHIVVKVPGIKRFKRLDTISEDFSRENLETMFKYKDASLASAVEHAMSLIPIRKIILTPYQRKCYTRIYHLRLAEKKRFTYKSAYLYEQIRKMHEQQEEYLVVVKYDVKSFVDLVHLKFRLQQLDEELCKVQKEMYRDRASLKRSCKNANELEFFETSEGDYRECLEQIKLQKKDNLKNLKVVEWCLERDGSMLDAEMEYRISVDDMVDLEEIEKDEPDLRKGDILKYEEAKSASNKADYMRMSVAEKVRCYPFDEKRTEQIIETMGLLGINCREDSRVSGECVS